MGLFEDQIQAGLQRAEFLEGWLEAEAELSAYYAAMAPVFEENQYLNTCSTASVGETTVVELRVPAPVPYYPVIYPTAA